MHEPLPCFAGFDAVWECFAGQEASHLVIEIARINLPLPENRYGFHFYVRVQGQGNGQHTSF